MVELSVYSREYLGLCCALALTMDTTLMHVLEQAYELEQREGIPRLVLAREAWEQRPGNG